MREARAPPLFISVSNVIDAVSMAPAPRVRDYPASSADDLRNIFSRASYAWIHYCALLSYKFSNKKLLEVTSTSQFNSLRYGPRCTVKARPTDAAETCTCNALQRKA